MRLREHLFKVAAVKINDKNLKIIKSIFQIQHQQEPTDVVHEHFQSKH